MTTLHQLIADQTTELTADRTAPKAVRQQDTPETPGFTAITGGPDDDLGYRRARGGRGSLTLLGGITVDGYVYQVETFSNPDVPEVCKYFTECGQKIPLPSEIHPCEFEPPFDRCRCNPCQIVRYGKRKPGHQPETCGSDECRRRLKRDNQRRYRATKKAL